MKGTNNNNMMTLRHESQMFLKELFEANPAIEAVVGSAAIFLVYPETASMPGDLDALVPTYEARRVGTPSARPMSRLVCRFANRHVNSGWALMSTLTSWVAGKCSRTTSPDYGSTMFR